MRSEWLSLYAGAREYRVLFGRRSSAEGVTYVPEWDAQRLVQGWLAAEPEAARLRRALQELAFVGGAEAMHSLVERGLLHVAYVELPRRQSAEMPAAQPQEAKPAEAEPTQREEHYIQIQVVDDDGQPVHGVAYELKLPDRRVRRGVTGGNGVIYYADLDPGSCELTFPELDQGTWEQA